VREQWSDFRFPGTNVQGCFQSCFQGCLMIRTNRDSASCGVSGSKIGLDFEIGFNRSFTAVEKRGRSCPQLNLSCRPGR